MATNGANTGDMAPHRFDVRWPKQSLLALVLLVVGASWVAFTGLGQTPLCQPAEGLNGDIARSMLARGDWIVPHHNGCLYVDKPPLLYWVSAVGLRLFGETEFGARFGVAWMGLMEVVLIFLLGKRLYGPVAGFLSAAVLATSVGHVVFSRLMMVDTLFSTCLTATFLCFALGYQNERRRLLWWTLGGAAAGLAVLTKSLIGMVLPGITLGGFVLLTRQWRLLRSRAAAGAALGVLGVALPWHLMMGLRVPNFAHYYFWNEQIMRFFGRREPLDAVGVPMLAFLVSLLVWALPWGFFLPQMLWRFWRDRRSQLPITGSLDCLPWLWLVSVVGFFALAKGRLFYYSLPALAAFALLAGRFWSQIGQTQAKRFHGSLLWTLASMALMAPLIIVGLQKWAAPYVPPELLRQMLSPTLGIAACSVLGALGGGVALVLRSYPWGFGALAASVLISVIPVNGLFAAFGRYTSLGTLLRSVRLNLTEEDILVHRFVRDDNSELPFYLRRRVRILKRAGEFHQPILGDAAGYYIDQAEFQRLWQSTQPVFFFVSQPAMPEQKPEALPPNSMILAQDLDACICCNPAAAHRFRAGILGNPDKAK